MTAQEIREEPKSTIRTPEGFTAYPVIWDQWSGVFTAITNVFNDNYVMGYDVELDEDMFISDVSGLSMRIHSYLLTPYDLRRYI